MKSNKIYVTFSYNTYFDKKEKRNIAIECSDRNEALKVAMDINSYACFYNVRLNNCGRFKKGVQIVESSNYRRYFDDVSFID